ncbi:MAG: NAD(P)H-dependent oxidoreductase subunit E [Deltaproteobacteria bacterium]|nr:NAD(P)H-dependent oxidoreductase subunit E [Deltaproteobacteria bacterium]
METPDLKKIDEIIASTGKTPDKILPILQAVQKEYGYLPQSVLEAVCEKTEITPAAITGFSSFYDQFRFAPAGEHIIRVCLGTACHVKGAQGVFDAFKRYLHIPGNRDTDSNGLFTIEPVACLGCCTLAPVVQIGNVIYGHLTPDKVENTIKNYLAYHKAQKKQGAHVKARGLSGDIKGEIRVGLGSCCQARGSGHLKDAIEKIIYETGIPASIKHVGCVGMCYQTPLMEILLSNGSRYLYTGVRPEDAKDILLKHFRPGNIKKRLMPVISKGLDILLSAGESQSTPRYAIDKREKHVADFLNCQRNIATEHCGSLSPVNIDEYIEFDGFKALKRALKDLKADEVISEIEASGLRGRGGAGFPTYLKWRAVREQLEKERFIVLNGDEGDPGAFMDRMLMESYPFRVLEGMIIAAHTAGANRGYLYIRAEYPLAIERMLEAIKMCHARGFLGDNICDSGFSLDLTIVAGAGAFVCGEETALLASIMGQRGMPRLRPPYPAQQGLWGRPTLINNVETYALVPWIIRNGGAAFAEMGTEKSRGTKVFALAGKIARGGLIEVPMGVTLRRIVEEIGGGIANGLKFKAIQIGGPSGGCVPARLSDIPVDYESLADAGAIMGSGGLVVMDETDCMVDIARYFLQFTQNQSCGKCTYCRIGTRRMLEILDRLCSGKGKPSDIDQLEELAHQIKQGSLCALGGTAPNPVLSTLKYFREEYEAHVNGRCPAGKCKALIKYKVTEDCIGCTICAQHCPVGAITFKPYERHEINIDMCIRCGTCKNVCPEKAVVVE